MVRGGGDSVGAFGNHTGAGNIPHDFSAGQMAADAGFCALPHFDFDGGACFEIIPVNTKPARSHLNDGVFTITIKVLMQAAFTGVIVDAELRGGSGQAFVCIIADRAIAHCRKQNRHRKAELRRKLFVKISRSIKMQGRRLLPQKHTGFHRLPQGVDGRVGHLRSID